MTQEQIKTLHYKRGSIKAHITRFSTFLQTVKDDSLLEELCTRLEKMDPLWNELENIQTELELIDKNTTVQDHLTEREELENFYFKTVSNAKRLIKQFTLPPVVANLYTNPPNSLNNSVSSITQNTNAKLPKLNLPEFHGSYEKWLQFSDTYKAMIHNCQSISNIQKFWYLKSCIKGEAANVLTALEVSEANYNKAWDLLCERYQNKKVIIQTHLNAISDLQSVQKESHILLRNIIDTVNQHLRSLESLGLPVDKWDTLIIHIVSSKLDSTTKREWEEHALKLQTDLPTFKEFTSFLNQRCQLLEGLYSNKKVCHSVPKQFAKRNLQDSTLAHVSTTDPVCILCQKDHFIFTCASFLKLSVPQRINEIRKLKACNNCLRKTHSSKDCKNPHSCKKCSLRHNTLLHLDREHSSGISNQTPSPNTESPSQSVSNISQSTLTASSSENTQLESYVMLSTAMVVIIDKYGNTHKCRAILDNCSQSNFITERLVKILQLPLSKVTHSVEGFGSNVTSVLHKTWATIQSITNSYVLQDVPFLISNKITRDLPAISFDRSYLKIPQNIILADEKFNESGPIDLLIGASIFWELICVGRINLIDNHTVLQKTRLGWILSGPLPISYANTSSSVCNLTVQNDNVQNDNIQNMLERFWKIEECQTQIKYSSEERECEEHFIKNTVRDKSGRFIVRLPIKDNINQLGESFDIALKRFYAVEKKLSKNHDFKQQYVSFMNEYEQLGHMSKLNTRNDSFQNITYYLPHHGILKMDSSTTKLRVVFDGSAKTSTGISLNDVLKVGPTIQHDLFTIVTRFRTYQYVVTADIEKMYRMVNIQPDQRDLQRILWRSDPSEELGHYQLNTATYGTASASFLCIRSLVQVAIDNESEFPQASEIIRSSFYVDDLLTGFNSIQDGKQILSELIHILSSASFNLRKFVSNNCEILENIARVKPQSSQFFISDDNITKTLGLIWNSVEDTFKYTVFHDKASNVTKRTILSSVAQLFDPLGLIGPCTIKAKIFIQKLWGLGLHWDESIPVTLHYSWLEFSSQLFHLNSVNIPRHIICPNPVSIELHCFGDASEKAYGTCCYLRTIDQFNKIHVHLVSAKSRVAPLKMVTLPKLELCAALLGIQLTQKVLKAIPNNIKLIQYWTDSKIVLVWINTEPHRLKTFVSNRVTQIQQFSNINQWSHVPSESNPADIISRGLNPKELIECKMWWNGPPWMSQEISFWPKSDILPNSEIPEIKKTDLTLITVSETQDINIIDRFSSFTKLTRVLAYCLRFANNSKIRNSDACLSGQLSKPELDNSLNTICKLVQENAFTSELKSLRKSKHISPSSKIMSLNPFLDRNGLIRVGGRLKYSNISYNQKHPILLPHQGNFTKLVIRHEHLRHLHAGAQATLAAVRSNFWPINGRSAVRGVLRKCVTCFRSKPTESKYQMGDIPQSRLQPQRPFSTTGVDFAGPFHIKDGKTRSRKIVKCYLCIFICFVTKAAHLELSDDLSSESFLKCLTRFVSRRGVCTDIYSDNGTNFVGTERELKVVLSNLENNNHFKEFLTLNRINWHFSPPHAPNFGGLWEACVKSAKFHLKRIVGNSHLTFEGLYTVITQVEAVLNSRPLSPLSNDPNDLSPLTPSHFLIGEPLTTLPQDDLRYIPTNRLSHFKIIQQQIQHFWKRWAHEYLNHLQERTKWRQPHLNLNPGTLVLVKDENTAPLCWKMGRIIEVFPGKDGTVRVVNVKTINGILKRPISKICALPISS